MEYQRKKKQILSNVEYTSLLSLTLVENKLQRNFKSIVQALLLSQSEGNQMKEDLQNLAKSSSRQITLLSNKMSQLQKKLRDLESKQNCKPSLKNVGETEENTFQKKSNLGVSQPKLNINLVQSPINTQEHIPSTQQIMQNNQNKILQNEYQQLKDKVNKILAQRIDPSQMEKKLNAMKDSINLLKAEVKVLSDRQAKSARRVSLGSVEKFQKIQQIQGSNLNSSPTPGSQKQNNYVIPSQRINGMQEQFDRQINNLHIQVNSLKLSLQDLKEFQSQIRRKDNKSHIQIQQLSKNQKKMEERVQNTNDTFQLQIKEIKGQILNLQTKSQQQNQMNSKKSRKNIDVKENISPNANNQINDRISKLQAAIQGLVTEAQFKRFKNQMKDKLSGLQGEDQNIRKQLKQQVQMLTEILDNKQQQLAAINRQIEEIKSKINDMTNGCERKNNISLSRCEQLKKNLQNLREDLEFYKSMNQPSQTKVIVQTMGENSQQDKKAKNDSSGKSTQELKKYLNRKLHDQRTYLLGLIRDLQKKSGGKSAYEQDLVNVWDKLAEMNLFLNKKANQDDIKKSLAFYQKKLASIYQRITSSDQNNEDARVAKTNWFCLSCDKNLHNYQGKVGQHVVWDSLPIKPGHTKYYNSKQQKKSLPTLKR